MKKINAVIITIIIITSVSGYAATGRSIIPRGANRVNLRRDVPNPIPKIKLVKKYIEYLKKVRGINYFRLQNGTYILIRGMYVLYVKEPGKRAKQINKKLPRKMYSYFMDVIAEQNMAEEEFISGSHNWNLNGVKYIGRKGKLKLFKLKDNSIMVIDFLTVVAIKKHGQNAVPIMKRLAKKEIAIIRWAERKGVMRMNARVQGQRRPVRRPAQRGPSNSQNEPVRRADGPRPNTGSAQNPSSSN